MIYPQLGPQYLDEKDKDMIARMEAFYSDCFTVNQSFWAEADVNTRFEAGDQSLWPQGTMWGNINFSKNSITDLNMTRSIISMVSGHQRRNRKSTIVIPVEDADDQTADQYTKLFMSIDRQENISETISEAFQGALITGMNLLQVWIDYRNDPISGDIKVDKCAYNEFIMDPYFRKPDLSDCTGLWTRKYLTKREVLSLMPNHPEEILSLQANETGTSQDGKFMFMPENYGYAPRNLLAYDQFFYKDYRTQKIVLDRQTGQSMEWRGNDENLRLYLSRYPELTTIDQEIPTVRLAIVIQNKVFYDGPNPLGIDSYPFVPVFAYYQPQLPYFPLRVQSMVTQLRNPQYLYNRFIRNMSDQLESQVNSGWIYKENALVNPMDVFMSGNGKGLALKDEAQMTDVQKIQPGEVSQGMFNLAEVFKGLMNSVSGVNEELMGSAVDDKAGILSMLRQGAGLTTLQPLFDQLDHSQKLLGKVLLELITLNYTPGKVQRMLGEEPAPQFYNEAFGKYDVAVEEGLNTTTQKQMQLAQLLNLREMGIPIPDDVIVDAVTVQNKKKLTDALNASKQAAQQAQQMQMQSALQEQQARTELAKARAVADQGLGLERVSRVEENKALAIERVAAAEKDRDAALLDMVKALKEIDDIDLTHVQKLLDLSALIKQREQENIVLAKQPNMSQINLENQPV